MSRESVVNLSSLNACNQLQLRVRE